MKLGSTAINKMYLGSTEIKKAYLGSTLIFDNTSSITTISSLNPLAHYTLDSNGTDSTGNYNATLSGATITSDGIRNSYAYCDGVNDFISIPRQDASFSISMWVRFRSLNHRVFIGKDGITGSLRCVGVQVPDSTTSGMYFAVWNTSGVAVINGRSDAPVGGWATNTWYHLVFCFGTSSTTCYLNGSLLTAFNYTSTTLRNTISTVYLGDRQSSTFPASVDIDEITYFNEFKDALTAQTLYNSGTPLPYS
jgi:hypothetical protein